ncbi:MAG: caspase family protein, partial [Ignavibacteriae bacterium]|nr:caspase family protein [Ignavibacteriota bacterium]
LDGIPARQKVLLMDTCHSGELDKEDLQLIAENEKKQEKGEPVFTREVPGIKIGRKNNDEGFGLKNISELMQEMFVDLRRGSGAAVISSSGGLEVSYEGGDYKNGLFTYSILEGIKTMNADLNKDGIITVSELPDYVSDKVEKLTKGAQRPTARRENLENDFVVW